MNNNKTIRRKWLIVAIGSLLIATILVYFYFYSPIKNDAFFPICMLKATTGYDCVGCGGQRAVHELLHFRLMSALDHNALFVLSIPLLIYYIVYSLRRFIYGIPTPNSFWYSSKFGMFYIMVVLLFLVLRNINIFPFKVLNSIW